MTVFTREQKCAIWIIIQIVQFELSCEWRYFGPCVRKFTSRCVTWIAQFEWSFEFRMTVFWTLCTQNYIAMRDLNCAIQMTVWTIIWIAQFKLRIAMWFGVHGPKYRHSNDNSNCSILMLIQIAHFCPRVKTVYIMQTQLWFFQTISGCRCHCLW